MPLLTIEQAQPAELSIVLAVLDELAAWLTERGIDQWPGKFAGHDDWRAARIQSYIKAGQTWLVRSKGEVVATFTTGGPDEDYAHGWPSDPKDGLYVYRMAVRRFAAGHDIGGHILDWCAGRAVSLDKEWLRIDCHRHNYELQAYYVRHGFERVGTVVHTIPNGRNGRPYTRGSGALYQRPAGSIYASSSQGVTVSSPNDRHNYDDESGTAAIYEEAARVISELRLPRAEQPRSDDDWNTALDQAARELERRASEIRQGNGMYYRVLDGGQA